MGPHIDYHKHNEERQHENDDCVNYEQCGRTQKYTKKNQCKRVENVCHTRYIAGAEVHDTSGSLRSAKKRSAEKSPREERSAAKSTRSARHSTKSKNKSMSLAEKANHCYEIKRVRPRGACNKKRIWQCGKYVHDDCGSGIVPTRFDFTRSRKLWCKTPLTMYQATIGEMARKLLCRETIVHRDVKPGPPCNIGMYIMPKCRGYYRKYDCLRPCEEEYAIVKRGKKQYRDRVKRYWEPCLSKHQKFQIDVNDYAQHNVYLGIKMRRTNLEEPCW